MDPNDPFFKLLKTKPGQPRVQRGTRRTPRPENLPGGTFSSTVPENPDSFRLLTDSERKKKALQLIDLGWPGEFVSYLLTTGSIDEFPLEHWSAVKERRYTQPEATGSVTAGPDLAGPYGYQTGHMAYIPNSLRGRIELSPMFYNGATAFGPPEETAVNWANQRAYGAAIPQMPSKRSENFEKTLRVLMSMFGGK